MKLKTVTVGDKTYAEVQDGKPVFIHDDGKEIGFDAPQAVQTISARNAEAKSHRERAEKAEGTLKTFEGITDPAAALKALQTVKNLDDKKLIDAGDVEKIKVAAIASVEEKYKPVVEERDKLKADLVGEKIGGAFARSKFITEKTVLPGPAAQKIFGDQFKIEDGKVVAYDGAGNKVFSRAKPGEPAEFEEALEIIVDGYSYKDSILKGSGHKGDGARGSNGGGGGGKTMSREAFNALDPAAKAAKMREGFTLTE